MLNEQAVMEYARQATDNAIDIMKYLQLLILPDEQLQSIQQEYYSLSEDTDEEVAYKEQHLGSRIIYDDSLYKVVFNLNNISLDKKEQLALPAYYSILNGGLFSSSTTNNTTVIDIDNDLISKSGDTITINNYSIDDVSNLDIKSVKNLIFKRNRMSGEDNITNIYSLAFNQIGNLSSQGNTKLVFRDLFTNSTNYFNSYFRDYFYSYFDEDYMMEMTFEQIVPNVQKGLLFNRQFYAYANGGNFYFTQFSNSKILSYGSKFFWSGDHFVFKKGVEGSIDNDKAGRYFSFQYSTGEEGNNPSTPFLNIHKKGEYLNTRGGEVCTTISNNVVTDFQLDRDLVFFGDYFKEIDVMINNKLYFGDMSNWSKPNGVRKSPASIFYDDNSSEFRLRTPSNTILNLFGTDFESNGVLKYLYNDDSFEIKGYDTDGQRIPVIINGEFDKETNLVPRFKRHTDPNHSKTMIKTSSVDLGNDGGVYYNSVLCVSNWATNDETGGTQTFSINLPTSPIENEIVTIWIVKDLNQIVNPNTVRLEIPNDNDSWVEITTTTSYIFTTNEWRLVE